MLRFLHSRLEQRNIVVLDLVVHEAIVLVSFRIARDVPLKRLVVGEWVAGPTETLVPVSTSLLPIGCILSGHGLCVQHDRFLQLVVPRSDTPMR